MMERVEGYDHQPGHHCGAAALRNVTAYYDLHYTEAACFGIGGGAAFVLYDHPTEPWVVPRASPTWLERAFLERAGIPHTDLAGETFDSAWANATARVEDDDPVLLFLDPADVPYLPEDPPHLPPHVAVLVGYDEDQAELSDAAMTGRQVVDLDTLEDAWSHDAFLELDYESLVVTRARRTADETDAAAAGLRQAATYMLDPLEIKRDARGPGQEGLPALRAFGDYLAEWPDLPEPARPIRAARRSIDEHGDGTAYRALFAESLSELGQRTGLPQALADRMADAAQTWEAVAADLGAILEADEPAPAAFETAASRVGEVAEREEAIFAELAAELGPVDEP